MIDDLHFMLNQLNIIFFQPFRGKKPNEPNVSENFENFAQQLENMRNDFENNIKDLMKGIDSLNSDQYNISDRLKNLLITLKNNLIYLKNNNNTDEKKPQSNNSLSSFFHDILSHVLSQIDFFSNDWIKIKDKFKITFEKEVNNFIKLFKEVVNNYTTIINKNYIEIKKIFDKHLDFFGQYYDLKELKRNYQNFKYIQFRKFIKNIIDKDTSKDLERVLVDIKNDILEQAEKSLDYEHSKNIFDWAHKKLSNSKYLNTYFDYIIDKSGYEFENFILRIEENSNYYFEEKIKKPIENLKNIIMDYFDDSIEYENEKDKKDFEKKKKFMIKRMKNTNKKRKNGIKLAKIIKKSGEI